MKSTLALLILFSFALSASAFNLNSKNNLVGYWGQNSGSFAGKPAQTMLGDYCNDSTYDVLIVSFLNTFFTNNVLPGTSIQLPGLNLSNQCWYNFANFPSVMNCPEVGTSTIKCQSKGKIILLALGGAVGSYGFPNAAKATEFANTIWNMFLGGTNSAYPRPFGAAQLDGVDLDIEGGGSQFYDVFVNTLKSLSAGAPKKYYISAAPQCVYPDASVGPWAGSALSTGKVDFINIQFYNNPCGLASGSSFNYATWSDWVNTASPNTKIFVGAPGDTYGAGSGYITAPALKALVTPLLSKPNFGGVMVWDVSIANANYVSGSTSWAQYISQWLKTANPTTASSTTTAPATTGTPKPSTTSTTGSTSTTGTPKPSTTATSTSTTGTPKPSTTSTTGSTSTTGTPKPSTTATSTSTTGTPKPSTTATSTSTTGTPKPSTTATSTSTTGTPKPSTTGPSTTGPSTTTGTTTTPNNLVFTQTITSQWGSSPVTSQISGQIKNNGATSVSNPKFTASPAPSGMWGLESSVVNGVTYWSLPSWSTTLNAGATVQFGYAVNSANPSVFTRVQ
eukprot:gene9745-11380_t